MADTTPNTTHIEERSMKTPEEIHSAISDYITSMKGKDEESLEFINQIMDYLMYLKRFLELKPYEKIAFARAMDGGELSSAERAKLDKMTTEEEKDHYIGEIARLNYFRRCGWLGYLHGEEGQEKPFVQKPNE